MRNFQDFVRINMETVNKNKKSATKDYCFLSGHVMILPS